jgi:hypothetical protein
MMGKINIKFSSDWKLLTSAALSDLQPSTEINYSWIYLSRHYERSEYLKKKFFEGFHSNTIFSPPFITWEKLITQIYNSIVSPEILLRSQEQTFLIHKIIHDFRFSLKRLSGHNKPFSNQIARDVLAFINEYLRSVIKSGATSVLGNQNNPTTEELLRMTDEYIKLKQNVFLDESDIVNYLLEEDTGKKIKGIFPGTHVLHAEIESPLPELHLRLYKKLREIGWDIHFYIHYDSDQDFFEHLSTSHKKLVKLADQTIPIEDPVQLNRYFYITEDKTITLPKKFSLWKFSDRFEEVKNTLKIIIQKITDDHVASDNFVITAPKISKYMPLLISSLKNYGIPYSINQSIQLNELLPIQHLQLFLELVSENGELVIIKKLLKSPFFDYQEKLKGIPADKLLNELRVGFDLGKIITQLEKSVAYNLSLNYEDEDFKEQLDQKVLLLETIKELREEIFVFAKPISADEFFNFFFQIIEKHRVSQTILSWQENLPELQIANIFGSLRTFVEALDIWRTSMNKLSPKLKIEASNVLELFQLITRSRNYSAFAPKNYGIIINPIQSLDSVDCDNLFILGMTDSDFPRKTNRIFFDLPEPYQNLLPEHSLSSERQIFLKCLQWPSKEIVISYPEWEGDSPQVPSSLVGELKRISGLDFTTPDSPPVYSKSEILQILDQLKNDEITRSVSGYDDSLIDKQSLHNYQRQLNILTQRNSPHPFGIYEGNLSGDETLAKYLETYYRNFEFSASALEIYAKSPMQFFFQRILNTREPEQFEDWVTPAENGLLIHQTLYRFYTENTEANRTRDNLLRIAREEIDKLPFPPSILWDIQKEFYLGTSDPESNGIFQAFFEYESTCQSENPLKPCYYELPFGHLGRATASGLSTQFKNPFIFRKGEDSIKLKGIVDRVEIGENGGILIVDYKTGATPKFSDMLEGISLQLPIYLKAISEIFNQTGKKYYPIGAAYYIIKSTRSNELKKEIVFAENKFPEESVQAKFSFPLSESTKYDFEMNLTEFLEKSIQRALNYAMEIRKGNFTHTLNLKNCKSGPNQTCPFEPLCRINHTKLEYLKSKDSVQK